MADHLADPRALRKSSCAGSSAGFCAGSFVTACLAGAARPADIDDWVDAWHESDSDGTLAEFLGFTPAEYSQWARDPATLDAILASTRTEAACPPAALLPRTVPAPTVLGAPAPAYGCPDGECRDVGRVGCYFGTVRPAPNTAPNMEGPLR